jgi:hypothetical protein
MSHHKFILKLSLHLQLKDNESIKMPVLKLYWFRVLKRVFIQKLILKKKKNFLNLKII